MFEIGVLLLATRVAEGQALFELLVATGSAGGTMQFAESLGMAQSLCKQKNFDAILWDIAGDGIAGLAEVLALAGGSLPVIILADEEGVNDGLAALATGAEDFLIKGQSDGRMIWRGLRYAIERRRHHHRAQALANPTQWITENLFEGVLFLNSQGIVGYANRAAERLLGDVAPSSLNGRHIDTIFCCCKGDKAVPFLVSPFYQSLKSGEILQDDDAAFELWSGGRVLVGYDCAPHIENGRPSGLILSFRDNRKLKEAQTEALHNSKLASVGQLAAGIAHEINTPIQYIGDNIRFLSEAFDQIIKTVEALRGFVADIPTELVDPGRLGALSRMMEEGDLEYLLTEIPSAVGQSLDGVGQVARIVLAMKEFSHPGEKEKVSVDLNRAIENTLAVTRNEWKVTANIILDLDPTLPPVLCLLGELNQVFLNLVINAVHAIQSKGTAVKGNLRIATKYTQDKADVIFEDDGIGMSVPIMQRIFDPFFTTKGTGRGTGQGLAICRDVVVSKHGGKILVESTEGKGSKFIVRLPLDGVGGRET